MSDVEIEYNKYSSDAVIIVSKKRSYEATVAYGRMKVCVHNFASATTPGGDVFKGSSLRRSACADALHCISA